MIICPCCGYSSPHPADSRFGYCGACHWFTGDPLLGPLHSARSCPVRSRAVAYTALVLAAASKSRLVPVLLRVAELGIEPRMPEATVLQTAERPSLTSAMRVDDRGRTGAIQGHNLVL